MTTPNEDSPNTLRVVSAVADKTKVMFYLVDGNTVMIKQGDPRLEALLNKIIPITTRGEVAVVELENFNVYGEVEKKTKGFIKFFKAAKKLVVEILTEPTEIFLPATKEEKIVDNTNINKTAPAEAPPIITQNSNQNTEATEDKAALTNLVKQIKDKPEPIPEPKKKESHAVQLTKAKDVKPATGDKLKEDETIVGVIGDLIIPDMEKLKPYLIHAIKNNSTTSVENFLKRIIPVIKERRHSVEDLLKFMEKADLPIAEDGQIIAYKVLNANDGITFTDCHTGKVPQKLGSYVQVLDKLVDLNRDAECSSGLHIARRGYIGGFTGDNRICVIAKVAPEDVMTVPHRDYNKVRVKGYHILFVLPMFAYEALKKNLPMTDHVDAQTLVARAIKGDHPPKLETVLITAASGGGIKITNHGSQTRDNVVLSQDDIKAGRAFDDGNGPVGSIDPKKLNKQVGIEREKMAQEEASDPTPSLNIAHKPPIQKFINTFSNANLEKANFAEKLVVEHGDVYKAFHNNSDFTYRMFVKDYAENVFDDMVYKIFTDAVKPVKIPEPVKETISDPVAKAEDKRVRKAAKNLATAAKTKPAPTPKTEPKKAMSIKEEAEKRKVTEKSSKPKAVSSQSIPSSQSSSKTQEKGSTVTQKVKTAKKTPETTKTKVPDNKVIKKTPKSVMSSKSVTNAKASSKAQAAAPANESLSPEVTKVLELHDAGKGSTEIAKITGIPRGTLGGWIKKHRPNK